ncbi:hypothetical protein Ddc_00190 [Ditylenchus destructor]|nr:hypothetical protein Ddc_00190 [Ditylenchus destructor]
MTFSLLLAVAFMVLFSTASATFTAAKKAVRTDIGTLRIEIQGLPKLLKPDHKHPELNKLEDAVKRTIAAVDSLNEVIIQMEVDTVKHHEIELDRHTGTLERAVGEVGLLAGKITDEHLRPANILHEIKDDVADAIAKGMKLRDDINALKTHSVVVPQNAVVEQETEDLEI